jgi:hypothetical protein
MIAGPARTARPWVGADGLDAAGMDGAGRIPGALPAGFVWNTGRRDDAWPRRRKARAQAGGIGPRTPDRSGGMD